MTQRLLLLPQVKAFEDFYVAIPSHLIREIYVEAAKRGNTIDSLMYFADQKKSRTVMLSPFMPFGWQELQHPSVSTATRLSTIEITVDHLLNTYSVEELLVYKNDHIRQLAYKYRYEVA